MLVRPTWIQSGEVVGATYIPVAEDACHFFVKSNITGEVYRIPHRNVYVLGLEGEPQDHKNAISEFIGGLNAPST